MYKQFYGLSRNPFEISPDPYFLFPTTRHNEALASIYHGVLRHKGFVVVTGEVGTGKTLLLRCLLELLRHRQVAFANVFNPGLSPLEFLRYIVADLGIKVSEVSKGVLLQELDNFLIARYRAGLTTVLVVDEAQHLSPEVLEEIRLLTNLETPQQKLLQIVLAGQPELEQELDSPQLRQLKQRVALRCRLEPLQEQETKGYILQRLQRAGADSHSDTIFPDATIAAVHTYSKGIPRLINTLCENALIAAYAYKARTVSPEMVDEVASDLRLNVTTMTMNASSSSARNNQQAVAKSLLQIIEVLERMARTTEPDRQSHEIGARTFL
jgi:general secretion pathway protein A